MATRGSYGFVVDDKGHLIDDAANLERARKLFRDGDIIDGDWGPGNDGDFDSGGWHVTCHLLGGSGIFQGKAGKAWVGVTYDAPSKTYRATATFKSGGAIATHPLSSDAARAELGACLGFVEGTSQGHISARGVRDADTAFNNWPRQMFDRDVDSDEDGGTVWEHWCTTRDLRASSAIGTQVLQAYLSMVAEMGGRFVAAVARGRRSYNHPGQLRAMVQAGLITASDALWDITPRPISGRVQSLLYEARPNDALAAIELLDTSPNDQRYFMFERRIGSWSKTSDVRSDLGPLAGG